jgi:MFS family permease
MGAMGIAMALAQIPAGYLADRFGSRSIMWASWIFGTIATWMMALADSLPVFAVGMVIYGLTAFVLAPLNSYITNVRGNLSVGRALSLPSGIYSLGAVVGPVIGGLVADRLGLRTVYYIAGVLFIISTLIILFVQKNPIIHHADQDSVKPKGLLKNTRFLAFLGVVFITLFALYLPQPFTPNFLQNQQHLSRTTIGILGAFGSLGTGISMLLLSHLGSLAGFFVSQLLMVLFAVLFLTGKTPFVFGLGYSFIGGYRLCRAMVLTIARSLIHPAETGLAYGLIETVSAVTVILVPVLAGALYQQNPYSIYRVSLILLCTVFVVNGIIFSIINKRKARQV